VLMTGIGTRLLLRQVAAARGRQSFIDALAVTRTLARGPKPVAALREMGLTPWLTAPSPNTWHEMLATLDRHAPEICGGGARVAIQEYGASNPEFIAALEARGARVTSIPVYEWALPEDVTPLRAAVRAIIAGHIDVLFITASIQLLHLLQVADAMRLGAETRHGLTRLVIASIGPMASAELRRQQLPIDLEPTRPKMGFLVKEAAEQCATLLHSKRFVQ